MEEATGTLQTRLEQLVQERWRAQDPDAQISSTLRDDGKIAITVISRLFEGKDGLERESLFWPVFLTAPRADLIQMTYSLLLTPEEAEHHFAHGDTSRPDYTDDWA